MSRSYRKPWVKDPSNSYMKKLYARAHRRTVKQVSSQMAILSPFDDFYWKDDVVDHLDKLTSKLPHRRAIISQYDICDFRVYIRKGYNSRRFLGGGQWEDNTIAHLKAQRK